MSFTENATTLFGYSAALAGVAGTSYAFAPKIAATSLMNTIFGSSAMLLTFASYAVVPVLALAAYAAASYFFSSSDEPITPEHDTLLTDKQAEEEAEAKFASGTSDIVSFYETMEAEAEAAEAEAKFADGTSDIVSFYETMKAEAEDAEAEAKFAGGTSNIVSLYEAMETKEVPAATEKEHKGLFHRTFGRPLLGR